MCHSYDVLGGFVEGNDRLGGAMPVGPVLDHSLMNGQGASKDVTSVELA